MLNLIPISDANPTRRFPIVTVSLIVANVLMFLFVEPGFGSNWAAERYFFHHVALPCQLENTCPAVVNVNTGAGAQAVHLQDRDILSFLGAVLFSTFLHGGWLHIIGNMLFLWIFGNNVEDWLGRIKYVFFYLLGGLAAGFAQVLTNLHGQGAITPAVGASGAVAAVMGAYFVLFPRARVNTIVPIFFFFSVIQLSAFWVLGLWFLFQVFVPQQGVAWQAHVGGFVFGIVAILLLGGRPHRQGPAWRTQGGFPGGYGRSGY
ncbi:MAG TPA: rhomboid family intramembrane serine protease [Actinomycetota bacterium]|nr:rhomboid family intramembrane serine protease [Actinomycetota bacterium]